MREDPLSIVTVVFESEESLLLLQARSIALFLPREFISELVVIDNTVRGISVTFRSRLLTEYGYLATLVRILRPRDICAMPAATGWRTQQVLKLAVAHRISTERYVLLDAKNHFVETPTLGFFESPDGRARVNVYGYETHPLRDDFARVLTYVGLDPQEYIGRFTATVTPFVLDTKIVKNMMADIERRSGRAFAEEFVAAKLLEFLLYSGWIISAGRALDDVFDFHQVFCPNVWPRGAGITTVAEAIRQSDEREAPLFSLHRKALAALDAGADDLLTQFWIRRGLFDSIVEAREFVADFRRTFKRAERRRKLREIPHKSQPILNRIRKRLPGASETMAGSSVLHRLAGDPKW